MKIIIRVLICVLLFFVLAGCSSKTPSPVAAPGAPVEIPSTMAFPKSLAVDVSPADLAAALSDLAAKSIALDGEYTPYIIANAFIYTEVNGHVDQLLAPISTVEIPVSPTLISFTAENVPGEGLTFEKLVFEFSDFDLDGDGNKEGCTGCTCPVGCAPDISACPTEADIADLKPVCFRIWASGIMFPDMAPGETTTTTMAAAGKFDKFLPTPDDPDTPADDSHIGAGEFRFQMRFEDPESVKSVLIKVPFNHNDPLHPRNKWTDLQSLETTTGLEDFNTAVHAYAEIIEETEPAGGTYLRTLINLDQTLGILSGPLDIMGQYRADQDFWSLRASMPEEAAADADFPQAVLDDTCVRFSTGSAVADDVCIDFGIFTDQLDFLLAPVESEMTFPADYPAEPPI